MGVERELIDVIRTCFDTQAGEAAMKAAQNFQVWTHTHTHTQEHTHTHTHTDNAWHRREHFDLSDVLCTDCSGIV